MTQNYESIRKEITIIQTQSQNIPQERIEIEVRKRIEIYENKVLVVERENRELRSLEETLRKRILDLERDSKSAQEVWIREKEQLVLRIRNFEGSENRVSILEREIR